MAFRCESRKSPQFLRTTIASRTESRAQNGVQNSRSPLGNMPPKTDRGADLSFQTAAKTE